MDESITYRKVYQILSEVENIVTVKEQRRIRPKLCTRCGEVRSCGQLKKFQLSDFQDLLRHFSITLDEELLLPNSFVFEFDFWKCSSDNKIYKKCLVNTYSSGWMAGLIRKYGMSETRSKAISQYLEVSETNGPDHSTDCDPIVPNEIISEGQDSKNAPFSDGGVCLMDSSFFDKFICKRCNIRLDIKQ